MASKFAVDLSDKLTADVPEHIVRWGQGVIDAELAEVREVLARLQTSRDCWCVATWKGTHDGRCQRARALYKRLVIR